MFTFTLLCLHSNCKLGAKGTLGDKYSHRKNLTYFNGWELLCWWKDVLGGSYLCGKAVSAFDDLPVIISLAHKMHFAFLHVEHPWDLYPQFYPLDCLLYVFTFLVDNNPDICPILCSYLFGCSFFWPSALWALLLSVFVLRLQYPAAFEEIPNYSKSGWTQAYTPPARGYIAENAFFFIVNVRYLSD